MLITLNSTIIGSIIGAIIGSLATWIFTYLTDYYNHNRKKEGAYAIILSEASYSVELLENFKNKHLKNEILIENEDEINQELYNFYEKMKDFPMLSNKNWIELISFIPDLFDKEEIDEINTFYRKCYELSDSANALSQKEPFDYSVEISNGNKKINSCSFTSPQIINKQRNNFRNDLDDLIKLGNNIKKLK